jgi:hypothetical protein
MTEVKTITAESEVHGRVGECGDCFHRRPISPTPFGLICKPCEGIHAIQENRRKARVADLSQSLGQPDQQDLI